MRKKTKFSDKEYDYLLTELLNKIAQTPKLKPDRDDWDIEGRWDDCGDVTFIDSQYMTEFALWRDFGCKTIKLINYGHPAVKMSFYSKHKYWLKKPQDLTAEEQGEYIAEHLNALSQAIMSLRAKVDHLPPLALAETHQRIHTLLTEIDDWQLIQAKSHQYELAVSTYQRGYAYLYISYKFILPNGDYDNASEHLLHHTRDRMGNINQTKLNVIFINLDEISRVHPQQNKEIEAYLGRFPHKTTSGAARLYARSRPELESQASFGLNDPESNSTQLDLFDNDQQVKAQS